MPEGQYEGQYEIIIHRPFVNILVTEHIIIAENRCQVRVTGKCKPCSYQILQNNITKNRNKTHANFCGQFLIIQEWL